MTAFMTSGSFVWALLLVLLSSGASSFSWPKLKPSPSSSSYRTAVTQRRWLLDRISNKNGTECFISTPPTHASTSTLFVQEQTSITPIVEPDNFLSGNSIFSEQELIDGYNAHQSLLKSMNNELNLDLELEQPALLAKQSDLTRIIGTANTLARESSTTMIPILNDVWKARLLLLLSAALYGTNFTMVKSLDETMSVGLSSTLRFGFAALVMLPLLFAPIDDELKLLARERRRMKHTDSNCCNGIGAGQKSNLMLKFGREEPTRLSAGLAGMEIGMYNSIGYIAQAVGLKTTTASKSAFICSMAVVTVPILDYIWGKELLKRQVIGACLAAFGVWALELGGQQNTITDGDVMSLIQPLMFGLGFWRMEAAMEKYPTEAGRLAAAQLLMVFFISLSYLVCWSPAGDDLLLSDACSALPTASEVISWLQDPYLLGMLFWTGIVTTAFTIWMETLALKTLTAAETTLIFSTEPLFGAAFAAVVANECLGTEAAIGAAFIIGGCIVSGMDIGKYFSTPKNGGADGDIEPATVKDF